MVTWHATARTLHTPLFGDFRVSGWGFGVKGFGVSGWGRDDMRPAWKRGTPRKDTSTCTLLYLETSGFRGGVSGWGRDCYPQLRSFSFFALQNIYSEVV